MAIDIVDFPINSMVIFHSYVNVYQRVLECCELCPTKNSGQISKNRWQQQCGVS